MASQIFDSPYLTSGNATSGSLLIGNSNGEYSNNNLTVGDGLTLANGEGSITLDINNDVTANNIVLGGSTYNTGTAFQSGKLITIEGGTVTPDMVGGVIIYDSGESSFILNYNSSTTLTASVSLTVSSTTYTIKYGGFTATPTDSNIKNLIVGTVGQRFRKAVAQISGDQGDNTTGPHLEFYQTSSIYPLVQFYNTDFDNSTLVWDAFYHSTSWKRSSNNTPFWIRKHQNVLKISTAPAGTENTTISDGSWADCLVVNSSGIVDFSNTPTINGTNILNESSDSNTVASSTDYSMNFSISCKKIGNTVTAIFSGVSGTNSGSDSGITVLGLVPSGFRPSEAQINFVVPTLLNSTPTPVYLSVYNGGDITINDFGNSFPQNTEFNLTNTSVSWLI